MRQGDTAPRALDFVMQPSKDLPDGPEINQEFARQWDKIDLSPFSPHIAWQIKDSAESARSKDLYNAGTMLLHWLGGSGEQVTVDVDEMINALPGLGLHIMDTIGFDLGKNPPPMSDPKDRHNESIAYRSERYTVSVYDHGWKQVGKGIDPDDDIYGSHDELRYDYDLIANLREGNAPEGVPQETFDWYLAINKFFYSPRVAVALDKETEDVEVALVVNVRDHYAWYQNDETGIIDRIMSRLEHGGYGRNFPIHGQSSVITGRFNLRELTSKNDKPYYKLRDVAFAANE